MQPNTLSSSLPHPCSFVNPLPIRAVPAEGATFADLASSAAAAIMDALSNSLLPMQEVVEAAGVVRQPGVNPLFQVGPGGCASRAGSCIFPSAMWVFLHNFPVLPAHTTS